MPSGYYVVWTADMMKIIRRARRGFESIKEASEQLGLDYQSVWKKVYRNEDGKERKIVYLYESPYERLQCSTMREFCEKTGYSIYIVRNALKGKHTLIEKDGGKIWKTVRWE
jgi:hypothetical protein